MAASNTKKGMGKFILVIVILLLLIIAGGLFYILNTDNTPNNGTGSDEILYVTVPNGASTSQIAELLQENKLIENIPIFKIQSKLMGNDGKYKAGTYGFSDGMTSKQIMDIIVKGEQSTTRFTVQEGLTVEETAEKVAESGICTKEEFLYEVANGEFDYWFTEGLPVGQSRLEGFLYPNTYDVFLNATAYDVVNRMLKEFEKVYPEEYKTKADELGYSTYQIITIAAMIERETLSDEERPIVASVIYNRLNTGMKLQIDATVQYALGDTKSRLYNTDLEIDSPYNTYKVEGLPQGPICSPSESSIKAALYPESTNYLYYVLKPELNGTHNFASTAEEFNTYKKAYINAISN